ncbi:MAG: glutamate-cysteine ligase family protein, partial [Clostridia bacterium]|nr:glutamate-cysteine ligase family protein [Clostridia bacterium]
KNSISNTEKIGLELEHFITQNGKPVGYFSGISEIVGKLAENADRVFTENGNILGYAKKDYAITLEPGGQVEISTKPYNDSESIKNAVRDFYDEITPILKAKGMEIEIRPVLEESPDEIELLPKERYRFMDEYFKKSGNTGRKMMRCTTSAQVSVDYLSEADFVKKYRLAYILSPFFALFAEGKNLGKRITIWNNTDSERTKIPDGIFSEDFGFSRYAEYILSNKPIFIPEGDSFIYTGDKTSLEVLKETKRQDLTEHFLSMVFPDVRLKQYIEIRIADALPLDRAIEYAEFIKGIFYGGKIDVLLEKYKNVRTEDIISAKNEIVKHGKNAVIYGKNAMKELNYLKGVVK